MNILLTICLDITKMLEVFLGYNVTEFIELVIVIYAYLLISLYFIKYNIIRDPIDVWLLTILITLSVDGLLYMVGYHYRYSYYINKIYLILNCAGYCLLFGILYN
jgi:hypothetical protein